MAYAPTFIYPTDAAALKTVGAPTTVTAGPVFDTLVSEAQNLIKEDLGAREGLTTLITNSMIEQAEAAFASLQHEGELPDGMRDEVQRRAEALASSISEAVGFAIMASIVNFHGTTGPTGSPILTYVALEPAIATLNAPALPVSLGLDPVTGAPLVLKPS
tara:strand:- start:15 stop:494 length:480 start_codon:yes stop_codon:yes gene_type:complete